MDYMIPVVLFICVIVVDLRIIACTHPKVDCI